MKVTSSGRGPVVGVAVKPGAGVEGLKMLLPPLSLFLQQLSSMIEHGKEIRSRTPMSGK